MRRLLINVSIMAVRAKETLISKLKERLQDNSGNWIEETIKYVAAIAIGLVVIAALIVLFKEVIVPLLGDKIKSAFDIK